MMRRWRVLALAAVLTAGIPASTSAGLLSTFGIVDAVPDYDAAKPGTWLQQIDTAGKYPKKPYAPEPKLIKPYLNATLPPEVAFALANGAHIARVEAARALCQSIVDKLLAQWKGPLPTVRVVITSEASYGAQANFTGDIFVNIGTFNANPAQGAASMDELALMLGHELSHFLLMHLSRKQFYQQATDFLGTAASIYATTQMFNKSHMEGNNLQVQGDQQMFMNAVVGGLAATMLVGDVFSPAWGRDNEEEADRMGVDLARAAGYRITDDEIQTFIGKHSDEEATRAARKERLKAMATLMILAAKTNRGTNQAASSLDLLLKVGGASLLDKVIDSIGGNEEHPDKALRLQHLQDYASKFEPEPAPGVKLAKADAKGFYAVAKRPEVQQVVNSAIAADHVFDLLTEYTRAKAAEAQVVNTTTGVTPVDNAAATQRGLKKKVDDQVKRDGDATPAKPTPAVPLPSACRGNAVTVAAPPPSAKGMISIDLRFPVDAAPYTWRIRGDWQQVSPGCSEGAVLDYDRSAKTDLATLDLMHKIVVEYAVTNNKHRIPEVYARYTKLIGTDLDFPDLAVADALIRGDQATAETKAADCLVYHDGTLWPTCEQLLGYDPTTPATPAKTPEGQKAFRDKSFDRTISSLTNLGGLFGN